MPDHAVRAPLAEARAGAYTGPVRQTILGHRAAGHRRSSWPPTVRGGLAGHEDGGQEPDLPFRRLWRPECLPPPPTQLRGRKLRKLAIRCSSPHSHAWTVSCEMRMEALSGHSRPPIVRRFPSAPRRGWEAKRRTGSSASPACDGCARRGKQDPNKQFDPQTMIAILRARFHTALR